MQDVPPMASTGGRNSKNNDNNDCQHEDLTCN